MDSAPDSGTIVEFVEARAIVSDRRGWGIVMGEPRHGLVLS
jgi:hypothetical protein